MTLRRRDIDSFRGSNPAPAQFISFCLSRLRPPRSPWVASPHTWSDSGDDHQPRGCRAFHERCDTERLANPLRDLHEPARSSAPADYGLRRECRQLPRTRLSSAPWRLFAAPSLVSSACESSPERRLRGAEGYWSMREILTSPQSSYDPFLRVG